MTKIADDFAAIRQRMRELEGKKPDWQVTDLVVSYTHVGPPIYWSAAASTICDGETWTFFPSDPQPYE